MNNVKLLGLVKETPIKNILTANGLNSLIYFQLARNGVIKLGQLDGTQLRLLSRVIKTKSFIPWVEAGLGIRPIAIDPDTYFTVWNKDRLVKLSSLTSKQIREIGTNITPVTSFRIGLTLDIGEALTWGHRINQLTSSRHKATMLKVAHGDIYTKDRKLRFGLADNDRCDRCGQPDSRTHTIASCPKALELWNLLREMDNKAPLTIQCPDLLKDILGASEPVGGTLAINAEVLQLLVNSLDNKISNLPPRLTLRIILTKLHNQEKGTVKDEIKALLNKLAADV